MTHAYTEGAQAALTALAWLAGLLTVLLCVTAILALIVLGALGIHRGLQGPVTRWRLTRTHARSGRLTGPQ